MNRGSRTRWLAALAALGALTNVVPAGAAGARPGQPMKVKLPFPPGETYRVIQGNHWKFSHRDAYNRFACGTALKEYFGDVNGAGRFDFGFTLFRPDKRWDKNPHVFSLAMARVRPDGSYASPFGVPITIYRDPP